jgi:hypothetical protein
MGRNDFGRRPVLQIEPKTLGINPRRAMEQIVDYKNDPGNADAWPHLWDSGRVCNPRFNDIKPMYWT